MASAPGWQATVGFSERMAMNMRIKTAYKSAQPDLSAAELASRASSAEEKFFQQASSLDEFKELCVQAATELAPPPDSQTADISPTYDDELEEDIGPYKAVYHASGLFSTIYRSKSAEGSSIAIKVTTPRRMSPPHDSEREARLLKLAPANSNVIPLLSSQWIAGGHFLLVFPFLACSLGELLDRKALSSRQQKRHLKALFQALEHMHAHGIIHRDVKPSNILSRSPDGPAYLADFGIAWSSNDPASEPADAKITDVGTTCYRPPELLFGYKAYGEKLDMWAAGCVVAECLRDGKSLFEAGDLGSELALLRSIFTTLGTPTDVDWPEAPQMPDWGKMQFTKYLRQEWTDVLAGAEPKSVELVDHLIRFQSTERLSAAQALQQPFFEGINE